MGVASPYGAILGVLACPVFSGVPLGVLGAVLGGVRTGGGFWVAGAGFRRAGARSGRSGLGLGWRLTAPRSALGSGGGFWVLGRGSSIGNLKPNAGGAFGSGLGVLGVPLWGWGYAPKISQRARMSSPLQSSP